MQDSVEKIAKAICAANNGGKYEFDTSGKIDGEDGYCPEWLYYQEDAIAAIKSLQELGLLK